MAYAKAFLPIALVLTVLSSGHCEEAGFSVDSLLERMGGSSKNQVPAIRELLGQVLKTRGVGFGGTVEEESRALNALVVLADRPDASGEAIFEASRVLRAWGSATPQAVSFAKSLLGRTSLGDYGSAKRLAVEVLHRLRIRDDSVKRRLLQDLADLQDYSAVLQYLGELYGQDPDVSEAVMGLLEKAPPSRRDAVMAELGVFRFDKASARRLLSIALASLSSAEHEVRPVTCLLAFSKAPEVYRGLLSQGEQDELLRTVDGEDGPRSVLAFLLLLVAGDAGDARIVSRGLARFTGSRNRESYLLLSLGFLPAPRMDSEQRQELDRYMNSKPGTGLDDYALGGIASLYIRSGPDPQEAAEIARRRLGEHRTFREWAYGRVLWGVHEPNAVPPDEWRSKWSEATRISAKDKTDGHFRKYQILRSVTRYPTSSEVKWLLESYIKDGLSRTVLVETLWQARRSGLKLGDWPALAECLEESAAKARHFHHRAMAAALLADMPKTRQGAVGRIERLVAKEPSALLLWSPAVDILLELDPQNPLLQRFGENQSRGFGGRPIPGGEYAVWLLTFLQGKEAGTVPTDALLASFKRPDSVSLSLALSNASAAVDTKTLSKLRSPSLFFSAREKQPLLAYLGALDRLELKLSAKE